MPVDGASYSSLPESCSPSCCLGGADVGSTIRDFMTPTISKLLERF
jgi:hypothetical protein